MIIHFTLSDMGKIRFYGLHPVIHFILSDMGKIRFYGLHPADGAEILLSVSVTLSCVRTS